MGQFAQRMPARKPAAFTASMVLPPPTATATSAPVSLMTWTSRSTSLALGTPWNVSRVAVQPGGRQRRLDVVPDQPPHQVVGHDERRRAERLEVLAELVDRALALHVPARG